MVLLTRRDEWLRTITSYDGYKPIAANAHGDDNEYLFLLQ